MSDDRITRDAGDGPGRRGRGGGDPPDLGALVAAVRGLPGAPLPEGTRREAEARTGVDLSATRVHQTPEAARYAEALGARAFTFDRDIVVGHGADAATIAHEVVHAAQFARHGAPALPVGIADPAHAAHAEANGNGVGAMAAGTSPGGLVQLQEATAPEKKRPAATTWHGDLYRAVVESDTGAALYGVLPADAKLAVQGAGAAQAFDEAFFQTVLAGLTEADADALAKEFSGPTARLAFEAGLFGGVAVGVVKDLYSNLTGLYEIVKLGVEYSPLGMTARALADAAKLGYAPQLLMAEKRAEAAYAQGVIDTAIAFASHIASNPTYLVGKGEEMGAACGEQASEWFHGEFLHQSPLKKGYTVGEGIGMIATEVALLFLGPEEWIARGVIAVGQAARATRLGKLVIELLSKLPEVARLVRLRTEINDASEALKAAKKLGEAGEKGTAALGQGEKGLATVGEVPKDVPVPKAGEPHTPGPDVAQAPEARAPGAKVSAEPRPPEAKTVKEPVDEFPDPESWAVEPAAFEPPSTAGPETAPPPAESWTVETSKAQAVEGGAVPDLPSPVPPRPSIAAPAAESWTVETSRGQALEGGAKVPDLPSPVSHAPEVPLPVKAQPLEAALTPAAPRDPAIGKPLKSLTRAERTRVETLRTAADAAAAEIRSAGVRNGNGLPPAWDHAKHPFGPHADWQYGDAVDMPSGTNGPPGYGTTVTKRVWETLARDELSARKAGLSGIGGRGSRINPIKEATGEELEAIAKSGQMPERLGAEIEHERIPQRVQALAEEAGLSPADANEVFRAADSSNLLPTNREVHAAWDEVARWDRSRNPTLPNSLDERFTFPLGGARDDEIAAIVDRLNARGIKLGDKPAGLELREILRAEKERRKSMARWTVP